MQHAKNRTNPLIHYGYSSFAIPLCGIATLFLIMLVMFILPRQKREVASALEDIMTTADSPSVSLAIAHENLSNTGVISDSGGDNNTIISMTNNITISANLINSYNLQIVSGTANTALEGPSAIKATTFSVSTAEGLANNTWGYSWNNGNYKGISTSGTTIANDGISAAGSVNYTRPLTFAAKFDKDADAGHYKTKVNILLTATPKALTTYTLSYNANGGNNAPSQQSISNYDTSHTFIISSSRPSRSGYEFQGWATTSSGTVTYQPEESIQLQASNPTRILYAVWKATAKWSNGVDSGIIYMHEIKSGFCTNNSNIPIGATIDLKDKRDETTYKIIKWDDDRCWMYTNLTLYSNSAAGMTLDSTYSDISAGTFILPQAEEAGFNSDDFASVNAFYATSSNAGATGYYTWCTATAGSAGGCKDSNGNILNPATAITSGNAANSICPKNWKLPIGGSSSAVGSFNYLVFTRWQLGNSPAGSNTMRTQKGFVYTGRVKDSSFGHGSSDGYWWSRTANSANTAYALALLESSLDPLTYSRGRFYGYAIRCVAQF